MKKENFEKAKPIVENIDNIEKILSNHKFGWDDGSVDFIENSNDFYQGVFFNIKNYDGIHSTCGGRTPVSRIMISEHNDSSGAKYCLTKQQIISLQDFIKKMLTDTKQQLIDKLEKI